MQVDGFARKIGILFFAGLSLFLFSACTRSLPDKATLTIAVPSELSSFSTTEKLEVVIINARPTPSSPPAVWEYNSNNLSQVSPGGFITITIEGDIPSSSTLLIQFLGVFAAPDGAMKFSYGDTNVDSTKSGDIIANITSSTVGASDRMGRVGGRYITASGPPISGPTGTVITKFKPGNGQPAMAVQKNDIVNGWFSVMAFNGTQATGDANFEYTILKDDFTSEVLFAGANGNLNLTAPIFNGSDDNVSLATKVDVPPSYRLETYSPTDVQVRANAREEFVVGFFRPGPGVAWPTGARACYPGAITQNIPGLYTAADLFVANPLPYKSGGGATYAHEVVNDGQSGTAIASCRDPNLVFTESLNIYANKISEGREEVFGMRIPFRVIHPERDHDSAYVNAVVDVPASFPVIQFSWKYLPDVVGAGVNGLTVYSKYFGTSGFDGGGGDEQPCNQFAQEQGYLVAAELSGDESLTLNNPPGHANFTFDTGANLGNEVNRFGFLLCPYRNVGGVRKYYTNPLQVQCIGESCDQSLVSGFGSKIPGEAGHDYSSVGSPIFGGGGTIDFGFHRQITNVLTVVEGIDLNVGSMPVVAGDEVIAIVMANHSNDCGSHMGQQISAGRHVFARVVAVSPPHVTLRKGTFLDKLIGNPNLTVPTNAPDHCYVQLVKVAEFGNFTLNSGHQLTPSPFSGLSNLGGGIIALKVSGTLTLGNGSVISATGAGFQCCDQGPQLMTTNVSAALSLAGGGGSHIGPGGLGGGDAGNTSRPGHSPFSGGFNGLHLLMGTSGGSASGANGTGFGGGIVFINARKIVISSGTAFIKADGLTGGSVTSFAGGGGGGAGSVIVNSHLVQVGANALSVTANGGNGGNANTPGLYRSGGGGGGGYVDFKYCLLTTGSTPPSVAALGGIKTGNTTEESPNFSTNGGNGSAQIGVQSYYCPPVP